MSTPINDGGPAFPHGPLGDTMHGEDGREWHQYPAGIGMTLRDYFAGQVANGDAAAEDGWGTVTDELISKRVNLYYRIADAMLAEREGKK